MIGRPLHPLVRPLLVAALGLAPAACTGSSGTPWSGAEFVAGDERTVSYKVGGWRSADDAAKAHCGEHGRTAKQIGHQVLNSATGLQIVYYDCVPAGSAPSTTR